MTAKNQRRTTDYSVKLGWMLLLKHCCEWQHMLCLCWCGTSAGTPCALLSGTRRQRRLQLRCTGQRGLRHDAQDLHEQEFTVHI